MSKQMIKKHKKWTKPQLIILGRGKTEENILAGCKNANGGGPASIFSKCLLEQNKNWCKDPCSLQPTS